jgi:hypothetical protein
MGALFLLFFQRLNKGPQGRWPSYEETPYTELVSKTGGQDRIGFFQITLVSLPVRQ